MSSMDEFTDEADKGAQPPHSLPVSPVLLQPPSSTESASSMAAGVGDESNDLVPGTSRYKPFRSPNPSPYALSASYKDTDNGEEEKILFGQRDPYYRIRHEKHVHHLMCLLAAKGSTPTEIAKELEMTVVCVSNVLRQPENVKKIREIQDKAGQEQINDIFKRSKDKALKLKEMMLDAAIEKVEEGKLELTGNVAAALAESSLDRYYGKAKQPLDAAGLAKLDFTKQTDAELINFATTGNTSTH